MSLYIPETVFSAIFPLTVHVIVCFWYGNAALSSLVTRMTNSDILMQYPGPFYLLVQDVIFLFLQSYLRHSDPGTAYVILGSSYSTRSLLAFINV